MTNELLELDPVTDEKGTVLSDQDIIDAAERPEKVLFEHDGMKFMVWVRKSQVPMRLWNRLNSIHAKIAFKAGFKAGDDPGKMPPDDERLGKMVELMMESESKAETEAEVALAATIINPETGEHATNVPQLKSCNPCYPKDLLALGGLGGAFVQAVVTHLRPTSTPGEADPGTTNPASDTQPSES